MGDKKAGKCGALLLGLDLGTTGAKAGVFDGPRLLSSAMVEYPVSTPEPGWAEQSPDDWWSASKEAIRRALRGPGVDPDKITGVGLSGQMHGAVLLDSSGRPVRPCILWCDQRTSAQAERITSMIGVEKLSELTCNPSLTGFTAPKLLWVRDNEPGLFERVETLLLPKDYINFMLTGLTSTEVSDASGTLLFDVAGRRWSEEMIPALDIPPSWLPEVRDSIDPAGTVTREAADATGLPAGAVVAAGGADNACGALGMGILRPGGVAVSIGSSGTVLAPVEAPLRDPEMRLHTFCHAAPGAWYVMGVVLSAGQALRWFRDELGEPEVSRAREMGVDEYELLDETASKAPAGCGGVVFLPYLAGERTPHADPFARGVFFGLDLSKKREHLVRSVMEGVVFALDDSVRLMRDLDVPMERVVSGGGGARSDLWRSMQADVFGLPIARAGQADSAMLGASMLAGVASGVYGSIDEAASLCVSNGEPLEPDAGRAHEYRPSRETFARLYPALRDIFPHP
jgi:xylulokinase